MAIVPPYALYWTIAAWRKPVSMPPIHADERAAVTRINLLVNRDYRDDALRIDCPPVFSLAFRGLDGNRLIDSLFAHLPDKVRGVIILMKGLIFRSASISTDSRSATSFCRYFCHFLGRGVDIAWLYILVAMNLQTSSLGPPFGGSLPYLKDAAPPTINTRDIYDRVMPLIGIQLVCVVLLCIFPGLVSWRPAAIEW